MTDPAALTAGDFESLEAPVIVTVAGLEAPVALKVEAVKKLPPHKYREAPFSVMFAGPHSPRLTQGMHALTHPTLGAMELFLVPVAQDASGTRYELTIN